MTLATDQTNVVAGMNAGPSSAIDSGFAEAMAELLDRVRHLRSNSLLVRSFGPGQKWTWALNGAEQTLSLDEPRKGIAPVVEVVPARHVFIFYENLLVGYLSELRAGYGWVGYEGPDLDAMLADFAAERGQSFADLDDDGDEGDEPEA